MICVKISRKWADMKESMNIKRLIIWSIIATGISSVTTQLLIIREFLTQFQGNEITISLVLFCWLLLTGLGSLGAKLVKLCSLRLYSLLMLIIALLPLLQLMAIREFRDAFFIHGVSPGFYPIFCYILFMTASYCLLVGFVLPYSQKVLNALDYHTKSSEIYLTDSLGDVIGGALFSFILVYWIKPFHTIALTSAPLILVAVLLMIRSRQRLWLPIALFFCAMFYYCALNSTLETQTMEDQYGSVVKYVESPFGRIVISQEGAQNTFWESGTPLYSGSNVIMAEEKVHYPLCQLDRMEEVLLISGGLGQTIPEIAKYRPTRVDYVELDPHLTNAALQLGVIEKPEFLHIINTDGRRYIKNTKKTYDAIIVDLPDPDTYQINRFFTHEFFGEAKRILKKGGILSTGVEYAPNYISDIRKEKLAVIYNTARLHFTNVLVLPGEEAFFLCSNRPLQRDIPSRLKEKSIKTSYVEGFFYGDVTERRIRQLEDSLGISRYINTDFEPKLMNIVFKEWFMMHGASPRYFIIGLLILTLIYILAMRREEYILFSTGLATMGSEMLIIIVFQAIYGYIYLKIGAIVTASLLGLLPGAMIGARYTNGHKHVLVFSEIALIFLLGLFYIWITYFKGEIHHLYFLAYCFLFACFCGIQFPVATGIIGEKKSPAAGCFAADLCGACVGAIATGTVLIPLMGIQFTVIFLILVKVSSSIIIPFIGYEGKRQK